MLGHGAVRAGMAAGVVACARGPLLLPRPPMEVVPALLPPSISLSSAACRPRGTNGGAAAARRIMTAGTNGGAADPCAAEFGRLRSLPAMADLRAAELGAAPSSLEGASWFGGPRSGHGGSAEVHSLILPAYSARRPALSLDPAVSLCAGDPLRRRPSLSAGGSAALRRRTGGWDGAGPAPRRSVASVRYPSNLACKSCSGSGRQHFFRYPAQHAANVAHSVRDTVRRCRQS